MVYNRTGYAPWSLTREAGVQSATVDGTIEVPQYIQPVLDTGFVDEKGNWKGTRSSDEVFKDFQTDLAIANNGEIISNKVISTYGFNFLNIAIQVTRAGDYFFELLYGGDDNDSYLNLNPIATSGTLKSTIRTDASTNAFMTILSDQESIGTANAWFVFQVNEIGGFQTKLKITNQSGGNSNIQTAVQRLV